MSQLDPEYSIIDRAIGHDPTAYRLLLTKYTKFAFSIALRIVKNREDAEEVVQDSFVKAFKALRNFNKLGKFSTWLYKIVFNTALTRIRIKRIVMDSLEEFPNDNIDLDIPENYIDSFEMLVKQDQTELLKKALFVLSESEGLAITLYYTCENTITEIETITGWNPSTVKIRLFRARQKLYIELSRMLKDELKDLL